MDIALGLLLLTFGLGTAGLFFAALWHGGRYARARQSPTERRWSNILAAVALLLAVGFVTTGAVLDWSRAEGALAIAYFMLAAVGLSVAAAILGLLFLLLHWLIVGRRRAPRG